MDKKKILVVLLTVLLMSLNVTTALATNQGRAGIGFVGNGVIFHSNYASTSSTWAEAESITVGGIDVGSSISGMGFEHLVPEFLPPLSPTGRIYQFAGWRILETGMTFTMTTSVNGVMHVIALWHLPPIGGGGDEEEGGGGGSEEPEPTPTPTPPPGGGGTTTPSTPDTTPPSVTPDETPETEYEIIGDGNVPLGYATPSDSTELMDIADENVPLGYLDGEEDDTEYIIIGDVRIPLGAMPQTGLENTTTILIVGIAIAFGLATATGFIIFFMRKEKAKAKS
ncbi:MAG: LPXTG cell wall anchor domain-containing protein [Defluviitaleaceae bacterium]|nr:LPXTG cell wall anchor domain-containing protein [Defluviitaleaceae bacterium]